MNIPSDCRYAKSHEWARPSDDGLLVIGITDYAQNSLGDITYVQLPKPGTMLVAGQSFGVVESVKAASDLYAPVSGEVVEVNGFLERMPEVVNRTPFAEGWMIKLRPAAPAEFDRLLDAAAYAALTA